MTLPFGKFFWSDYASDPALKLCSFAAQGLWMRMLCLAAEHDPVGYVAVNGRGLECREIARATGGDLAEVDQLIDELDRNGVFSRDRRGWIYSRRMIRDAKLRRNASEWGKKGGNPKLRNQSEKAGGDKGSGKGGDNLKSKPHIPESRVQRKTEPKGSSKSIEIPLPDDWDPEPFKSGKCKTIIEGWSPERLETEAAKFKAHHRKRGNKWVSWQAAWETWVLNSVGFDQPRPNGAVPQRDFADVVLEEVAQRERAAAGKPP